MVHKFEAKVSQNWLGTPVATLLSEGGSLEWCRCSLHVRGRLAYTLFG